MEARPWLADYVGLSVVDEWGAAHLERADVEVLVRGQVVVVQRAGGVGGWVSGFTGVQVWPVVDRLWGRAASVRDGSAPLGADFVDGAPRFALWLSLIHIRRGRREGSGRARGWPGDGRQKH